MADAMAPEGALIFAMKLAKEAGAVLRSHLGRVNVNYKGIVDLVTEADRASEEVISERIRTAWPEFAILGEEGIATTGGAQASSRYRWVADPLDGTTNFAHGYPHFCVSIGLALDDQVVVGVIYDPMRDELFTAERGKGAYLNGEPIHVSVEPDLMRSLLATGFSYDLGERGGQLDQWRAIQGHCQGIRRDGAAALNLAYVASGRLDGFWEEPLQPWDMAAGSLLVEEAGGRVSAMSGGPFSPFGRGALASNGRIHEAMRSHLG